MLELFKGHIRLCIEEPNEGYQGTRFDWTGKILQLWWKDIPFCTSELENESNNLQGYGFFNEFGIDRPIAYNDCKVGESFPKIGVGMLQKECDEPYDFFHQYPYQPFHFTTQIKPFGVEFQCDNDHPVFGFRLTKTITLDDDGFVIDYELYNRGQFVFDTNEYVHNFLSVGKSKLSADTQLVIGKAINPEQFNNGINPDACLVFEGNQMNWKATPRSDFFFEQIAEPSEDGHNWCITNKQLNLSISETTDFKPGKINLWGRAHVVSPELFKNINLQPGETERWQRVFEIKQT